MKSHALSNGLYLTLKSPILRLTMVRHSVNLSLHLVCYAPSSLRTKHTFPIG